MGRRVILTRSIMKKRLFIRMVECPECNLQRLVLAKVSKVSPNLNLLKVWRQSWMKSRTEWRSSTFKKSA